VKIFNWLGTMWGGTILFRTPLLFAVGFISMFLIGGLSGVMHAVVPVNAQHNDTYFVVAHFHYVLFGGSIFGLFAGVYDWWPKFTGKMLSESIGKVHFWLMLIGFNLTFFPMHILGALGMPRRIGTYTADQGWEPLNALVSFGAVVITVSIVVFMVNVLRTARTEKIKDLNPWGAPTLE
jgi:cytochrome c oxidase subunit I